MLTAWDPNSEKSMDKDTKKKIDTAYNHAKDLWGKDKRIEALKSIEKTISVHRNQERCFSLHELKGHIFFKLANKTTISDIKRLYLFASLDAFSTSTLLCPTAVMSFHGYARSATLLGDQLGTNKIYEKVFLKAKQGLAVKQPQGRYESNYFDKLKKELETLMNLAAEKKDAVVTYSGTSTKANQMVLIENEHSEADTSFDRLKSFWVNLDDKTKRELMVIDFGKLIEYIQRKYGTEVKEYFQKCVPIVNNLPWKCWKCHICSQVNYCLTDCKMHILDNHVLKFEPKSSARPKCVDMVLADMICCGNWEPVDTAAAENLIKDRIELGEEFVYVNGWCSDWPVAKDKERENILKQFAEVLKSSCPNENNTLSCTLWNWLIGYTEKNLELPQVAGNYLDKLSFFESPQCICFLGLNHLKHILEYFTQLFADARASLVLNVVNELWRNSMVKERINLEGVTTYNLLLDEKLLYDGEHDFDEKGIVGILKSSGTYENVIPMGDKFVSWVVDCPEIDQTFVSQMAKGEHNFEIWSAALGIVRWIVRKVITYYDERLKMVTYEKMLGAVETICDREDKRKNANQKRTYALTLGVKYEEKALKQVDDDTKCFLNVVIDVLKKAESPTFVILDDKRNMEDIRRLSTTVSNDNVKESLSTLRKSLKEKFHLVDSKILLNEYFCKELHGGFPKLSTIEYRLVVDSFREEVFTG